MTSRKAVRWLSILLLASSVSPGVARAFVEDYEVVSASTSSDSSASKSVEVECPLDTSLLGGGAGMFGSIGNKGLVASQALLDFGSGDAVGWAAEAREVVADTSTWSLSVFAICGDVPGLERVGDSTGSDSSRVKDVDLLCPPGKLAISGGFEVEGASQGITIFASTPEDGGTGVPLGWTVSAIETIATESNWSLRAQALCADVDALLFRTFTGDGSFERARSARLFCPAGYVPLGGGGELGGSIVDWITSSYPFASSESWLVSFQRQSGETANSRLDYRVVCPEPRMAMQGLVALATLVARRRRRYPAKRG